jgi:hypothetical protein
MSPNYIIINSNSNNNNSSDGSLVDFPSRGRDMSTSTEYSDMMNLKATTPNSMRRQLTVTFANMAEVSLIDKPPQDDIDKTWNSKQEMNAFKRTLLNDGRRMAKFLANTSRGSVTNDELVNCIGIEFLLSPELLAKARDGKRLHSAAVLSEQARQRVFGECNADDLARISRDNTRSSRRRAHTIASMYQQM